MRECAARVFCIDHHPTRGTPWKHNILEEGAPATSGMIYELTTRQGWKPSPRAAMALYAGLATDTGFFRFNSTTSRAHARRWARTRTRCSTSARSAARSS